jgi:nitroreductase
MSREDLLRILDLARWAPSGDNTQPWRFEIIADDRVAIHGHDTRDHVVYDFDGHASHMAHGALLETLRLAATRIGRQAQWQLRPDSTDRAPIYDVQLLDTGVAEDPLAAVIEERCVQRRPMATTPLTAEQREALATAVGPGYRVQFFGSWADRQAVARLLWHNARLRLTCPEAYEVHRAVIEWRARYSTDRIPEQAVGVDPLTARLMHWVMGSWRRVEFFNRYLLGTIAPRIQLDLLPALGCAAHVLLRPLGSLKEPADYVAAGMALQRLWLTATHLGLHLQPEMTPVIFRWYVQAGRSISRKPGLDEDAAALARRFERLGSATPHEPFAFFCRVGQCRPPRSRSLRTDLDQLMVRS